MTIKDCIGWCYECKTPIGYPGISRTLQHLDGPQDHAPSLAASTETAELREARVRMEGIKARAARA